MQFLKPELHPFAPDTAPPQLGSVSLFVPDSIGFAVPMPGPEAHDLASNGPREGIPVNSELSDLMLPGCLERVAGGGIRVTGHRVSLFRILDALFDGLSIERIGEMFPSVPPQALSEVVEFCNNQPLGTMRRYHADQMARFSASAAKTFAEGPSSEELRQRQARKQQTK